MKEGDFVMIEYTGRVSATGEVFDLTSAEEARKEGIFSEKQKYGPALVVMGAGMTVPGVERHMKEMTVGEEREFGLKPEEGFGNRNPKFIRIISIGNFLRQKINPVPGIFVTIDNRQARVQSVSGGRVRVDFNHPLSGKELEYRVRVVKLLKEPLEKARSLLEQYGIEAETEVKEAAPATKEKQGEDAKESREKEGSTLTIKTAKQANPMMQKLLETMIKRWIKEIGTVNFEAAKK